MLKRLKKAWQCLFGDIEDFTREELIVLHYIKEMMSDKMSGDIMPYHYINVKVWDFLIGPCYNTSNGTINETNLLSLMREVARKLEQRV